jgi:hypothetical protein
MTQRERERESDFQSCQKYIAEVDHRLFDIEFQMANIDRIGTRPGDK